MTRAHLNMCIKLEWLDCLVNSYLPNPLQTQTQSHHDLSIQVLCHFGFYKYAQFETRSHFLLHVQFSNSFLLNQLLFTCELFLPSNFPNFISIVVCLLSKSL